MTEWDHTGVFCIQTIGGVEVPTLKCFEAIFVLILRIVIPLAALALFVMILIGGFKFLTSAGDQKATASAKQTITYAIMGIVLMVLAYLIFKIIYFFTGVDVFKFVIPGP